jgi:glucan phosphoethanolaminetransferase (alkaline phosphatase superfamily)
MVTGIISIVLAVIVFIAAFTAGTGAIFQQQVQYLMYICASILFVGGFILLKLNEISKKLNFLGDKYQNSFDETNPNSLHINELKEKFETSSDKEEKLSIAYELVELGETDYKKYLR